MKIVRTVKWYDPDTVDTVYLAGRERGIEVLSVHPTENENEALAVIRGEEETVERFLEDAENGEADPYEAETRDLSDEEYEQWLKTRLAEVGKEYSPKAFEPVEPETED